MTTHDKDEQLDEEILEEMQEEIEELESEENNTEEQENKEPEEQVGEAGMLPEQEWEQEPEENPETSKLKDLLARNQADFDNFKKRTQRDKEDMIFFLKSDILKKILPRVDDMERIIKNTPEELQAGGIYEWILAMEKVLKKDLKWFWVEPFTSIWEEVDPNKHDVMTKAPWKEDVIIDEFEKWYLLNSRVLRHAKVVVWAWE